MALSERTRGKQTALALVAIIVIAGSLYFITRDRRSGGTATQTYFFDVGTSTLFAASTAAHPPIDAASGPGKGVAAIVFGCGDCRETNRRIAYLSTLTPEARAATDRLSQAAADTPPDPAAQNAVDQGTMVAEPTTGGAEPKWYPALSPAGVAIKSRTMNLCDGKPPSGSCFPG